MDVIAPVAQLNRVLPSEGKGCGFDSRRVHQYLLEIPPFEGGDPQGRGMVVSLIVLIKIFEGQQG